jgi:hypothetical protein
MGEIRTVTTLRTKRTHHGGDPALRLWHLRPNTGKKRPHPEERGLPSPRVSKREGAGQKPGLQGKARHGNFAALADFAKSRNAAVAQW